MIQLFFIDFRRMELVLHRETQLSQPQMKMIMISIQMWYLQNTNYLLHAISQIKFENFLTCIW